MPDEDLVVEIPTEGTPPAVEEKKPEDKPALPKIEPVEDLRAQFDALKKGTEQKDAELRAANEAAERERQRAAAAEAEAAKVKTDLVESNVSAVESALQAAQVEADRWQREQQTAFEAGDFKAASDAGRKMAKAEARIAQLEEGKANLAEQRVEKPKPEERQPTRQPAETRSQQWLRAHPAYNVPGSSENYEAIAAHNKAMAKRIAVDSDEYFDFVETELGLRQAAKPAEKQPEQRTRAMPGAPVTRDDTPTGGQSSPTKVTLSAGEVRAANDGSVVWNHTDPKVGAVKGQPIGNIEYARRKALMTKQGLYDRSYTDQ